MGEACCVGDTNADYLLRIADSGLRIARTRSEARAGRRRLVGRIRNPQSAIRNSYRMKFPDRLPIPPEVLKIAQKLEDSGYETWCVGGAIRDNLLGLENHDFDLTTAAPPEEVRKLFKRTIPVGIEHGTVAVLDRDNRPHEVTTFRRDLKTDGRHEWRDPFKGVEDLERRLIRSVGDPNWRFLEDYLRILRALRFSARFEFRIHPRTLEAAKANVQGLAQLSAERVRDEWFKGIATAQRVSKLLALWIDTGAARIWLPEIRDAGNAMREAWKGVDKLPRDPVLITALLASDPASLLTRLKCSNKDIERGRAIGQWRDKYPDPQHLPDVRKWLAQVGEYAEDLLALLPAGTAPRSPLPKAVAAIRAAKDPLTLPELAVNGNDLIAAGVRPGPDVGEVLQRLLAEVLEDPQRNTKDYLLSRV